VAAQNLSHPIIPGPVPMNGTRARIFVADDNPVLLQGLERALTVNGYSVRTATNGLALLRLLETSETPDLLLLDVMMPEMDGLEVLRTVHADPRWSDLPVVLITAASDATLSVSALQSGAADFLTKPFRLSELIARVQAHVHRYRALQRVKGDVDLISQALDVVRDLNGAMTVGELFQLVCERVAGICGVRRCTVVVGETEETARAVSSSEAHGSEYVWEYRQYPEVHAAVTGGVPICVDEVATSPLFEAVRKEWEARKIVVAMRSVVAIPFAFDSETPAALVVRSADPEPRLPPETVAAVQRVVDGMVRALARAQMFESLVEQRRHLHTLAHTDELTGCASRRSLQEILREEFNRARAVGTPLSVVVLDIDHFKEINDRYGHLTGDVVLRSLGEWLRGERALRSRDCAGRFGGDEFVVVLPETGVDGAARFAERARTFLAGEMFLSGSLAVRCTLSAGVAAFPAEDVLTPDALLACADAALYQAKQDGRNCVRPEMPGSAMAAAVLSLV
jgi:two-component system, cell cycle response regulator